MIINNPVYIDPKKVEEIYTERDGVPVKYVCSSALDNEEFALDIFYRETPHPKFGNRYFGLYVNGTGHLMIVGADKIEAAEFAMLADKNGDLHYSAHRHDFKNVEGVGFIDGGRAYTRMGGNPIPTPLYYKMKDGEFEHVAV